MIAGAAHTDPTAFVAANTRAQPPAHVPEITMRMADDALPLWQLTEDELNDRGLPPPFWAFAWAGGQALARYILDHRSCVAGRRVLDLGAGGGLVAIAAARAGASHVRANEVDAFALAAIALNAADNGVVLEIQAGDILDGTSDVDVVLAGDIFYERPLADRVVAFLVRASTAGADVLIGDPNRAYLPTGLLEPIATYSVSVTRALEDMDIKRTSVWRLA